MVWDGLEKQRIPTYPNGFCWSGAGISAERLDVRLCNAGRLTPYVKWVATSDNSAETVVRVLIDERISQFDIPEVIGSDEGPHFTATVFQATCKELGIEHARESLKHPESQAQVERQN